MSRAIVLLIAVWLSATPAAAQIERCSRYKELIDAVVAGQDPRAAENLVNVSLAPRCFVLFVAGLDRAQESAFEAFVRRFEGRRADKQAGASIGEGSTTVVAQGPVARILSLAAEYGALTRSVSGQVITLRGNLAGVPSLLANRNVFPYCVGEQATKGYCVDRSLVGVLKRFTLGVSFDASRPQVLTAEGGEPDGGAAEPVPVTFTAKSREISSISVRVQLWNRRDVSTPAFAAAWRGKVGAAMDAASADLLDAGDFVQEVVGLPGHDAWFKTSVAAVRAAGREREKIVAALTSSLDMLAAQAEAVPNFEERVADALAAYSRFFLAQDELIDSLATKSVLAVEYTNIRPALEPARSNYRIILDYPISPETKVVANGAVTFYDDVPADQTIVRRYRDAQVGVQLDHGLGHVAILGPAVLSLAAYFQYQHSPALLDVDASEEVSGISFVRLPQGARQAFATAGNIWLVQGRLSLVPSESSVKIPLSVTWSNRTELVDKPAWRGQIGVSYDLDSLFGT